MKSIILILSCITATFAYTQIEDKLDYNQVGALLNTRAVFFSRESPISSGYNVPKDSCISVIYSSAFWFGGEDLNGSLHLASNTFIHSQSDFFVGPIATNYSTPAYQDKYNHIWKVSKFEINQHQQNYNDAGYVMPNDILTWPGNGDVSNGEAAQLAPYVDFNNNNIYDPENGDYPNIRGHQSAFMISNDGAGFHANSQGLPLGMEFHFMFYQYGTSNYLDTTTFINVRVFNRSNTTYYNFKMANYTDIDLGGANDDFVGSAPQKNMVYGYNGDPIDDQGSNPCKYGINPPAVGIKLLNHSMDVSGYFNNTGTGVTGDPNIAPEFWGYMNGVWGSTGVHFTEGGNGYGGTVNTNHLFSGNPNDLSTWSEMSISNNTPGDRRTFLASNGLEFGPGESICYDLAILYSRQGDHLENVNALYDLADSVQTFFDDQTQFSCDPVVLNVNHPNMSNYALNLYPNPSEGSFKVDLTGTFKVTLYSISGQVVLVKDNVTAQTPIDIDLSKGIYSVKVTQNNADYYQKLIVK